jgi:hypothetical protein
MLTVRGESLGNLKPEEVQQFIAWACEARKRTTFDAAIVGHPRSAMLLAEKGRKMLAYLLCQTVIMAEAFIPRPEATSRQRAASLGQFDKSLARIARSMNVGDVYAYVPSGEADYIAKVQKHGWIEIPGVRLFKKSTGITC